MKFREILAACVLASLAACGGGGGGGDGGSGGGSSGSGDSSTPANEQAQNSNLSLSVVLAEATVPAGGTANMSIAVSNLGRATARGVSLYAEWGVGFAADPDFTCAARGGAVCPPPTGSGDIPDIPPGGEVVFTAPITLTGDAQGAISSAVFVDAMNDPTTADNFAFPVIRAYQADVSVSGRGPATPILAGSTATYTMTVFNSGPNEARDVTITDTLGASQVAGTMTCAATGGATCPASPGMSMLVPRLPLGGSLVFTLPVQVAAGTSGTITNAMQVHAAGDRVAANNSVAVQASAYVAAAPGTTSVTLVSDPGDYIGAGRFYVYTQADSRLSFTPNGATLHVQVQGDQSWGGEFDLPNTLTQLVPGTYTNLTRASFRDPAVGGLEWTGQARGCNTLTGTIVINTVNYTAGVLNAIDLDFEQHCEGGGAALRGHVVWNSSDATAPPGPVNPAPGALWAPAVGATPTSGSYVYLQSDVGDYIGAGQTNLYTRANSILNVSVSDNRATVIVGANVTWTGNFIAMSSLAQLQPGYYAGLQRYPFQNPVKGGLDWSGGGRGCNTLTGWMAVDGITWNGSSLASLDLRFEQHCEGAGPALHGKVHWDASDTTTAAGPLLPIPASTWAPAPGSTPASGNYIYLESDPGDYIGGGLTSTITTMAASSDSGRVSVSGGGWNGTFQAMDALTQVQPGYYGNLIRYPFHNHALGGLSWYGNGRGCNTLQGWFAVDSVVYDAGGLASVDLRFEQHCEGGAPALHGKVHWAR